jgi:transglutaminase-like putative cysteine protease
MRILHQRLKFQVLKDGTTYNYDIDSGGTPSIFPLQSGDGQYTFRVMENITESKYAELYAESCQVVLQDSFQPFLRPSDYVSYSQNSSCVKKAAELAKNAPDKLGLVTQVFDYVCDNVTYDKQKAASVQSGYLPDPDETLSTGKGICFDYASLAAAMLRSQGIPVKVIFGYVSPNDLYHAWNMFYTEETGWVTVDYEVKADSWNRLDLTFSANGADGTFIGDGGNYRDLYLY